ncbi:hypothetical protein TNCV_108341 [Trichonephila clavipes]|nr:hypothetical protein TNCV_108341 [Trichonephila clavipes]
MGTISHRRAWSHKPRLVSENRDSISRRDDDEPDEGIWSAMVQLKKPARKLISYSYEENKSGEQVVTGQHAIVTPPLSLWSLQKSLVYETSMTTMKDLPAPIVVASTDIASTPDFLKRARQSFVHRCRLCYELPVRNFEQFP